MRILFVWAAAEWSVFDVARGYRNALAAQGHEISDFRLYNRLAFAHYGLRVFNSGSGQDLVLASKLASEPLIAEAAYHKADLVLIISGIAFHPNALWVLRQWERKVPVVLLVTESPYEDEDQKDLAAMCDLTFTNERTSARRFGWRYLRHAYDPAIHHPRSLELARDVFIVGTGWEERVNLIRAVDWTGVDLHIQGFWPIEEGDSLYPHYHASTMANELVAEFYASSRINLNQHRQTAVVTGEGGVSKVIELFAPPESLNPRAFEIAACAGFQLCDYRAELDEVFEGSIPVYRDSAELGELCRFYLAHDAAREALADQQHRHVREQTFEHRAREMMRIISRDLLATA
jgi:spore maturation protein CgeB